MAINVNNDLVLSAKEELHTGIDINTGIDIHNGASELPTLPLKHMLTLVMTIASAIMMTFVSTVTS